jgi:hypothetical protein
MRSGGVYGPRCHPDPRWRESCACEGFVCHRRGLNDRDHGFADRCPLAAVGGVAVSAVIPRGGSAVCCGELTGPALPAWRSVAAHVVASAKWTPNIRTRVALALVGADQRDAGPGIWVVQRCGSPAAARILDPIAWASARAAPTVQPLRAFLGEVTPGCVTWRPSTACHCG